MCIHVYILCIACGFTQGQSTYSRQIKQVEDDIQQLLKKINELTGMYKILFTMKLVQQRNTMPALWN